MNDISQQAVSVYDQIAAAYALKSEQRPPLKDYERFLSRLKPNSFILDAGCAACRDANYFIKHGHRVIGIDLSEKLLEEAKNLHPEVPTKLMDIRHLDFPNNHFDAVWALAVLLHLKRQEILPTLQEFRRVLKPGGTCFISVKQGQGTKMIAEDRSSGLSRPFTFFSQKEMLGYFQKVELKILDTYIYSSQSRGSSRHLNWIVVIGQRLTNC